MIVATAVACLAINIFHEARGETISGQYAVALVTMNRAERDRKQVCKVVFKPNQFSWTSDVVRTKAGWKLPGHMTPKDEVAWDLAHRIAAWTLAGNMPDFTNGSKFYHTHAVKPAWRKAMEPTKAIGAHQFYAQADR